MFNLLAVIVGLLPSCEKVFPNNGSDNEKSLEIQIKIDPSISTTVVKNIYSDMNMWDFKTYWTTAAESMPDDYFKTKYPFVKTVQFMTATGGEANRDLFLDPTDRSVLDDYNFEPLKKGLRNVIRQGLKPMIKTGAVPLKFSTTPKIGGFGVNVRPPDDYNQYYVYINALAKDLVSEFGINEVKTWSWGVLTEYENADWFESENKLETKEAFFKLYDFTVAALQDAIGVSNLVVGAHSMTCNPGLWNEEEFIAHCATGVNYKTGQVGTQVNFLAASYYDQIPGVPVGVNLSLENTIGLLKNKATASGLTNLRYGIDEGRILDGPDAKPLASRVVAHSFQASADAAMFKFMNNIGADWISNWGLNSEDVWGSVDLVGAHVANLCYKLVGNKQLDFKIQGKPSNFSNIIDGMSTYDAAAKKLYVLVYNHNLDMESTTSEKIKLSIDKIKSSNSSITIKEWLVDDNNGNFWPTWHSDMQSQGMTSDSFHWSYYSTNIPQQIKSSADLAFWRSKESAYSDLSKLKSTTKTGKIENNSLSLEFPLEHHAVVLYEIENIEITQ